MKWGHVGIPLIFPVTDTVHLQVPVVRQNQDNDDIVNQAPNQQPVEAVQGQQDQGNITITFIIGVHFCYVTKGSIRTIE